MASSSLKAWSTMDAQTRNIVQGVSLLVAGYIGIWICSEVWDKSVQKFAWSTSIRKHLRYRPGTMSAYFSRLLKDHSDTRRKRRPVRVYMDGCFDMMHYGHANALRQAKAFGDELVVGVVSDKEILANKGPPVFNEEERYKMVESVKWVDEIIRDVSYEITEDFLKELFTKHKIDYIIHGDDPCLLPDGTDAYEKAKKAGRYIEVKRTEGVSSTDIVGRMLLCYTKLGTQRKPKKRTKSMQLIEHEFSVGSDSEMDSDRESVDLHRSRIQNIRMSQFLPTSRRIIQFANTSQVSSSSNVVYIDGAFDLFHVGHVEILKAAKKLGDYLIVGLHNDDAISAQRGSHYPIMSLHERCLSVLACKYVDEIIIGAPLCITKELLTVFNISLVAHGTVYESKVAKEQYRIAQEAGIFVEIPSPSQLSTTEITRRILQNKESFEAKFAKKSKSEAEYYQNKSYVEEK